MKSSIKVMVRVRPCLEGEDERLAVRVRDRQRLTITSNRNNTFECDFEDYVLAPTDDQKETFSRVKECVDSALGGFNATIFAYGQTGSGKTYTMTGDVSNPMGLGIIPRAVDRLFEVREKMFEAGWKVSMTVHQLEIYNEQIKDLLAESSAGSASGSRKAGLDVKHSRSGETTVPGLSEHAVESVDAVLDLLRAAQTNRSVASTKLNAESSRSHSVFMLKVQATHEDGETRAGTLVMIDLAGSERVDQSGVTGEQLKEVSAALLLCCSGRNMRGRALTHSSRAGPGDQQISLLAQQCDHGPWKQAASCALP